MSNVIFKKIVTALVLLLGQVRYSHAHARLMEPPSRASMWRLGFPTPKDVDDNQSYCGGFGVQWGPNGGKCGICGDPWHDPIREHEAPDGIFATGIIGKSYKQGSYIPVIVVGTRFYYYWSCSPPAAEYALAIICQF